MKFRLGYVAMTLNLHDCSPSGTVTAAVLGRLPDEQARMYRLKRVAAKNLENTLRILIYNKAYNIKVYRLTSKLIPLATHPLTKGWDYTGDFARELKKIGDFIKENDFRVSAHPDHYTLINSPSQDVIKQSVSDLDYHVRLLEAMGLDDYRYKLVLHVGGLYNDREASISRFRDNFTRLPDRIAKRIILENDDKSYDAHDVLCICRDLNIPMVVDVHHDWCLNRGEALEVILEDIFKTWDGEYFRPKIHFSSPKSQKDFRSHADFINAEDFEQFLRYAVKPGIDFDVMLEAKSKDSALLRLSEQLGNIHGVIRLNEAEFEM
ncbi:UV-damage endonuclease [Anaerobacterium chartisolvens]|uniref:UV-damage endonuclease n=1 Tax=Anaerobacterium chartisolvens TaxID=1297424 RepID=A0A369BB98_9FIRM|nr:UV DNA damage repair endonuclease UvsE [Anaerobacterium chartisolvens]RCX18803.1 UV-damage endonuclease [Anaerobacterium chartisolvens]